jgi:hypothetical protein
MTNDTLLNNETVREMDPFILLSLVNTKLRDEFHSLPALCDNFMLDQSHLVTKLGEYGYEYIGEINQFRMP